MTPKPFDPTKPVQTRDGRKARIVCTDQDAYPIVALITLDDGKEYHQAYRKDGTNAHTDITWDLVNVPSKRWVNLYQKDTRHAWGPWETKNGADAMANTMIADGWKLVAQVEIDWPE